MELNKPNIYIVDTTLRDGEQRAGFAFSSKDKQRCAEIMHEIGIYQIEAGIPAMGRQEKNAILSIVQNKKRSLISTWNRMNIRDIEHSFDCFPDIIHISVPVSDIQIYYKLKMDRDLVEKRMLHCIYYAQSKGFEVTIGFEDASRADEKFLKYLSKVAFTMGIKRIRYADTVGISYPSKVRNDVSAMIESCDIDIEIHAHDDLGMAVANSLEAAQSGAKFIDTTFFGIGERAGNCNFSRYILIASKIFDLNLKIPVNMIRSYEKKISDILSPLLQ